MSSEPTADARLRVGCAMWAHRPWIGTFLPGDTSPAQLLHAYAQRLPTVEGNTTFYALPKPESVRRWAEQVPEGFRFVLKMPRTITHELRLRSADREVQEFIARMEPLGEHLGPTFVQLPASFTPTDLPVLRGFLERLPRSMQWAVEVRHRDFFAGGRHEQPLDEMLGELGVNRVILDARCVHAGPADTEQERDEIRSKPLLPVRPFATANQPVIRFIGQTSGEANPPYWQVWLPVLRRWIESGLEPYFFVHTPDNLVSPHLALRIAGEVLDG